MVHAKNELIYLSIPFQEQKPTGLQHVTQNLIVNIFALYFLENSQ